MFIYIREVLFFCLYVWSSDICVRGDDTLINFKSTVTKLSTFDRNSSSVEILSFERKRSSLMCFSSCFNNPICDTAVVCDGEDDEKDCFLVKGDVFQGNISTLTFPIYRALTKVVCENDGRYFDGICHCVHGFTGEVCELVVPDCCSIPSRTSSYINSTTSELISCIKESQEIKILVNEGDHDILYKSGGQGFSASQTSAWIQTLKYIDVDHQDRQNTSLLRAFKDINTNKYISTWRMNMEVNNDESGVNTLNALDVHWFATRYTGEVPCVEKEATGNILQGSPTECRVAVENGAVPYIFTAFSLPVELTYLDDPGIKVTFSSTLGHSGSSFTIVIPSYWYISGIDTEARFAYFRYLVKPHIFHSKGTLQVNGKWYIDKGWHDVYSHDDAGVTLSGSLPYLKAAVLNGKRIRVKSNNIVSVLLELEVTNDEIRGVMFDDADEAATSVNKATMIRSSVATSGDVISCTYLLESDLDHGWWSSRSISHWYVESKPWIKTLSFGSTKKVLYGSVLGLFNVAHTGKSIRVVIQHLDHSYQAFDINNIHLFNSSYVVLDTATQESVAYNGSDWICQQWVGFLSTDGVYETSKWTTGRVILQARNLIDYIHIDVYSEQY